jgi:hypothetical protein
LEGVSVTRSLYHGSTQSPWLKSLCRKKTDKEVNTIFKKMYHREILTTVLS